MNWTELSTSRRVEVLKLLENKTGLNATSIDKDWWVTLALNALFNGLYGSHQPETICFVPSVDALKLWEKDYLLMQENMIYGDSLSFSALIDRIIELNKRFNSAKF